MIYRRCTTIGVDR